MAPVAQRVLVVDDDVDMRELIVTLLKEQGIEAFPVTDGDAMIKVIDAKKHMDLIVLDLMMKQVNGLEALKQLRKMPHLGAYIPVVVVSGYKDPRLTSAAKTFGISAFVHKPFESENFVKVCKQAMLPRFDRDLVRTLAKNLRIQDPKLFEEFSDARISQPDYRIYSSTLLGQSVVVLLKNPTLPQTVGELSELELVHHVRIYAAQQKPKQEETRLLWPNLYAEHQAIKLDEAKNSADQKTGLSWNKTGS